MRCLLPVFSLLFGGMPILAQQKPTLPMTPEMTEIWEPEVRVITPGSGSANAPSDALVLFNGYDLHSEWVNRRGEPAGWLVSDGCFTVVPGEGDIRTKRSFSDFQLHLEWRTPAEVKGEGQGRGNSGVFLQGLYEVQILDSYQNRTYRNGQAASIYKQYPPLVNACKGPGEWQTYDIIYTAPRFNPDGTYFSPPRITVLHNGVLVQNNVVVRGPTLHSGLPEYSVKPHGPEPIVLQDHGDEVSFRNIWIREL